MRVNFCAENFLNLRGIYFFALQKDKCQEKVWEWEQSNKKKAVAK